MVTFVSSDRHKYSSRAKSTKSTRSAISSYSSWDEILAYFKGIADKYELYKYIRLKHKVSGAKWDEQTGLWSVDILNEETGEIIHDQAEILINGTGILK